MKKPLRYYENNLGSTIVLLNLMDEYDCRHLVFSSSATVYGSAEVHISRPLYISSLTTTCCICFSYKAPITEDTPTGGGITNAYGRTKYMIEEILHVSHGHTHIAHSLPPRGY